VHRAFGFRADGDALRREIIAAQANAPTVALGAFLDEVASELQREGITVRRLPLLNVPVSLLARDDVPPDTAFLMTWNNVVLEKRGNRRRAEGFASLLSNSDQFAKQAFAASGYRLDLFPPLINSIVLGGGYRCASNHVRPPR
jgi:hypothetical protein